jgi:hypothetical protein
MGNTYLDTTTAASALAIGNRLAYRHARSLAGGNARPKRVASVASLTVALAVVSLEIKAESVSLS